MENRYLYRAKRKDSGEWVKGYYAVIGEKVVIIEKRGEEFYDVEGEKKSHGNKIVEVVDPSTICQCTGLKDKNGKLIWENDIVRVKHTDGQEEYQENAKVSYTKRGFSPFSWEYYCDGCDVRCEILDIEVIGNIFDNPELLEAGKEAGEQGSQDVLMPAT